MVFNSAVRPATDASWSAASCMQLVRTDASEASVSERSCAVAASSFVAPAFVSSLEDLSAFSSPISLVSYAFWSSKDCLSRA